MSETESPFQSNQIYRVQINYQALLLDGSIATQSWGAEYRVFNAPTALMEALPIFHSKMGEQGLKIWELKVHVELANEEARRPLEGRLSPVPAERPRLWKLFRRR